MYFIIVEEYKNNIVYMTIHIFRKKFIRYYFCLFINKIRKKEIITVDR